MITWVVTNAPFFTAISAVVAALTFLVSTFSNTRRKRAELVREWQRVIIAEIFQTNSEADFSFSQLVEKYHSAATGYADHKLSASELSKATLRRIIVELVEGRVIEQLQGDTYRLEFFDKKARDQLFLGKMQEHMGGLVDMLPKMLEQSRSKVFDPTMLAFKAELQQQNMTAESIKIEVLNFIGENPGRYSPLEIAAKLQRHDCPTERILATAHTLMAEGLIESTVGDKLAVRNQSVIKGN